MEHLSNDNKDDPNQYNNSCKLCDEKGLPLLSVRESQWEPRQTWLEFPKGEKAIVEQIFVSE